LLATDSFRNTPIAGALVSHENEIETIFFLQALNEWLTKPVKFMTIDFSTQLESAIHKVFPNIMVQKCVFHSVHLLTKALLKELNRIKRKRFSENIEEWNRIRTCSRILEKQGDSFTLQKLQYHEQKLAWNMYMHLWNIFSSNNPQKVKKELETLFLTRLFMDWHGKGIFLKKYSNIFLNRAIKFSEKGLKYIKIECFRAWRSAILQLRREEEKYKRYFNDIKYLILMNPLNMKPYHKNTLKLCLKKIPWLRNYRSLIVKFYYQFRQPPEKRVPFKFLSGLITNQSHERLKAAVNTLIQNQEKIFYFQQLPDPYVSKKTIRIVNESSNRTIQRLFFTQHGMRTLENMRMRLSRKLNCPIIVSPTVLEQYYESSNIN